MPEMGKQILHIECGDESWTPTEKELRAIAAKFRRALRTKPEYIPVVMTRNAVKVSLVEISTYEISLTR
jgi:hypothetical protein